MDIIQVDVRRARGGLQILQDYLPGDVGGSAGMWRIGQLTILVIYPFKINEI
ncbi:hypothetical protein [Pseudomonas caspiana]